MFHPQLVSQTLFLFYRAKDYYIFNKVRFHREFRKKLGDSFGIGFTRQFDDATLEELRQSFENNGSHKKALVEFNERFENVYGRKLPEHFVQDFIKSSAEEFEKEHREIDFIVCGCKRIEERKNYIGWPMVFSTMVQETSFKEIQHFAQNKIVPAIGLTGENNILDRIRGEAAKLGLEASFHIISGGVDDMIVEALKKAGLQDYFESIHASKFHYDKNGIVRGVVRTVLRQDKIKIAEEIASKNSFVCILGDGLTDLSVMNRFQDKPWSWIIGIDHRPQAMHLHQLASSTQAMIQNNAIHRLTRRDYSAKSDVEKSIKHAMRLFAKQYLKAHPHIHVDAIKRAAQEQRFSAQYSRMKNHQNPNPEPKPAAFPRIAHANAYPHKTVSRTKHRN